jgi:hypothetical protein
MHVKIIKRAGHIPGMFDNKVTKLILEGSFGRRRPLGKPKNRCHHTSQYEELVQR